MKQQEAFRGGSDCNRMKQFHNYVDIFQKRGGVAKEAIRVPKMCLGGEGQGFAE